MSEAGRKPRRVQKLFVANPGSDSDDDPKPYYRYNPPPLPPAPAPLSTRVPRYPPSHPSSLSSPSSTSDPAHDDSTQSTPPPSTPGLGQDDLGPDRSDIRAFPRPRIRPPSPKEPAPDRLLILVTGDSERYVGVDITDAPNPAFIRECVFTKLNIHDDDQAHFSIYRTEIGSFAIGDALSDDRLFELCRERGDDKGSLKLLVSHSSARVHEPPLPPPALSPTSTILPPFVPFHGPLQPRRRRSRSRTGSVSSTSENLPPEAAGYDADQDDRPRANGLVVPNGLPQTRSVSPIPSRSSSPLPRRGLLYDKHGNLVPPPPPPPPLSPNRSTFSVTDDNITPPGTQIRVPVPDTEEEEPTPQRRNRPQQRTHVDTSSRRPRAKPPAQSDIEESPSAEWVMINGSHDPDHPPTPIDVRSSPSSAARARQQLSPSRYKASSPYGRALAIPAPPRNAPPPVPATSPDTRMPPLRPAGQPVPSNFPVTYKRPDRGELKVSAMPTSSSASWRRFANGSKSMDNIRAFALSSHPTNLQPAGGRHTSRQAPPVPRRDPLLSAGTPTSALGTPKSFESRQIRPLPIQGGSHTTVHEFSPGYGTRTPGGQSATLMSPSHDPYPRPQSTTFGEPIPSPNQRYQRQFQTSGFGSNLETDYGRFPRAPSPTHPFPTSLPYRTSRPDVRSSDRHSDPLQSPVSPRSPRFVTRDQRPGSSSSTSDNPGLPEITTSTLSEDVRWAASGLFPEPDSGTLMPETRTFIPPQNGAMMNANGTMISTRSFDSESSDDSGGGTWMVAPTAEPPTSERPKSILRRPPLTVQTDSNGFKPPSQHATFAAGSTPASQHRTPSPSAPVPQPAPRSRTTKAGMRESMFTAREEDTWAPRPPPEDVYERLEDFFPKHDLDKPVIEMPSGGTSPTATSAEVPAPPMPPPSGARVRGKKSIRLVAQERKRYIDRTSRVGGDELTAIQRKRSTKLWGSRVEEVDTSNLPESPSTSEGPTTFKWVRGELIGRGTYGRVYLALNATTGEMIAVKQVEIPRTASDRSDSRQVTVVQALKLESETLKVLDHPNIVQYLGFEETPANLSIFLEYVPGGSIGSCLLKHGRFDEDVTKSFTSQILAGLEYLHSKGILHRDLKSDNILVEMSGVCKISDFGISKRTDDQNDAHTAMQGTVFWMAPEVINTQKKGYSFKIDIWSIGCVVLEMWAGTRPWLGDEVVAVMFKLFQSKQPPPVPDGLVLTPLADDFRKKCFAMCVLLSFTSTRR
ncbi:hypothetical protein B0H19DRAFT_623877 [Mycena capillaripes]|nr:hypothetical protein B0H19DRAFT_623877 [Mycena capillaripes]